MIVEGVINAGVSLHAEGTSMSEGELTDLVCVCVCVHVHVCVCVCACN